MPVVGATPELLLGGLEFRERMAREYGDIVHWKDHQGHFYQLNHPDDIQHVLVNNNTNYVKGSQFQRTLGPYWGTAS